MLLNNLIIDENKCTGCGLCTRACPGMLLYIGDDGKSHCRDFDQLNWSGCWRCQHCLQICPNGAISVFGKNPEDSLPMWPDTLGADLEKLILGRKECKAFKPERIDSALEDKIFKSLANAPTGGNKMKVEYTVLDGNPFGIDVPHIFIPHAPANDLNSGSPIVEGEDMVDVSITTEYFNIIANAHGLATAKLDFPGETPEERAEARRQVGIPESHVILSMIGFGYPMENAEKAGAFPTEREFPAEMGDFVDSLVAGRNSCRHYKQQNVDRQILERILKTVKASINSEYHEYSNQIEFTVYDDIEKMNALRSELRKEYFKLTEQGIYPYSWNAERIAIMESREDLAMNGDMFFCSVPHIVLVHMPKSIEKAPIITSKALTEIELLAYAHGLGAIYLGYAFNVMRKLPDVKASLGISEDHFWINAVGFGYPEFRYSRGRQKEDFVKVDRLTFIKPGRYRHFKGNEYEVIGMAKHSETCEDMVVYRALYGEGGLWVRPAAMWNEVVERDGESFQRFTYIGE